MTHMQYLPGDPRVVDQLVYELKSRGIFDQGIPLKLRSASRVLENTCHKDVEMPGQQCHHAVIIYWVSKFRKECIADVDTRPAYQNLRQRVETSVATFLARQVWKPDLNKNQLREKLRKHILDGNYLEQGVERIVDQVVNPKVASVFIPQVEDLVYDFFGISRKKSTPTAETSNRKVNENDLLPTDLEAVSPGSVKSNDDNTEKMDIDDVKEENMIIDQDDKPKTQIKDDSSSAMEIVEKDKTEPQETNMSATSEFTSNDSNSIDKISIPLPTEEIKLENIPPPDNSPPKPIAPDVELEGIELPKEPIVSTNIPLPDEIPNPDKEHFFKPITVNTDDDSSSDSSLRRNMSPITPIRDFINENSCDAQQAFENETTEKTEDNKEPSSFRFTIEAKSPENSIDNAKEKKVDPEQTALSYQFNNQVNINAFNTPLYDESSNSNLLHIDYESDANSKTNNPENKDPELENSEDSKKERKSDDKKSSHKSSHHRHSSSSKDRRSDSKHSHSRDGSKHDKKTSSKDDHKSKLGSKEGSKDKSDKKDNRDSRESSKHRSSHKSSSSSHKDSKSHKSSSSSSSQRHSSSSKHSDEKRSSSSSHKDKSERSSDKSKDSKEKSSKDSKSSSHRSDKDRKSSRESSKSKHDDKDKKKEKKDTDDHYSQSGRGNHNRRSTDRDSNDGSSSSKGSTHPPSSKSSESKKDSKNTSKSDNTSSTSSTSTSPSDKELVVNGIESEKKQEVKQSKVVRVDTHLEVPISAPPRLPFVPDVTLKKPKFAENVQQARQLMKMRKFLDEEQKRMNQEAALLLEFQANVRPSLSQVYSSIPGPELEFACITNAVKMVVGENYSESENEQLDLVANGEMSEQGIETRNDALIEILTAAQQVDNRETSTLQLEKDLTGSDDIKEEEIDNDTKATVQQLEHAEEIVIPETEKIQIQSEKEEKSDFDEMKVEKSENDDVAENSTVVECEVSDESEIINKVEELYDETQNESVVAERELVIDDIEENDDTISLKYEENNTKRPDYFEVTIITEELSETEDADKCKDIHEEIRMDASQECKDENFLEYFGENEKYNAEIERDTFSKFLNTFIDKVSTTKMYLVNCDTYEENLLREVANNIGNYEIVNYYKNGHLKLSKNVVKDLNIMDEVTLPLENDFENRSAMFSPVKSECSFELSSDYDAKLEEMVNKTSRQEIMEIILGSGIDESPDMPRIDYCTESSIVSEDNNLKRKLDVEIESSVNNNRLVLTPNKIRKLSGSDQISSTTEEDVERSNNNVTVTANVRSKCLGRAKRVGLPRPKRTALPNSPSSDKSIENYSQNTPTPNGKLKTPAPRKVQRYDTSDLYKPKLHYLSRRNNIS